MEVKSIKIPKTDREWTKVEFNRTGIIINQNGAYKFKLKPQVIEGVNIPAMEIWAAPYQITANLDNNYPSIHLRYDKINEILKTLIIRAL